MNLNFVSRIILSSPLFIILIYLVAIITASAITRFLKPTTIKHGNHNQSIDGLRSFLALGVYIHHAIVNYYYLSTDIWQCPNETFFNEIGQGSVALFFMITAFLFFGKIIDNKRNINWVQIYAGRIFRLIPLYLLIVAVIVMTCLYTSNFKIVVSLHEFIETIICWIIFSGTPDINNVENTGLLIAFVTWSLHYEWYFYLSLPVLALIFSKNRNLTTTAFSLLSLIALTTIGVLCNPPHLSIMISFLGGFVAIFWCMSEKRKVLTRSNFASFMALLAMMIVFYKYHSAYSLKPVILLTIIFTIIASDNNIFGLLIYKPVLWLGEISYSIYLIHGLVLTVLLRKFYIGHSDFYYLLMAIISCVVLVIVSSITYTFIEKPGIALGKRLMAKSPL